MKPVCVFSRVYSNKRNFEKMISKCLLREIICELQFVSLLKTLEIKSSISFPINESKIKVVKWPLGGNRLTHQVELLNVILRERISKRKLLSSLPHNSQLELYYNRLAVRQYIIFIKKCFNCNFEAIKIASVYL